jgi:predicted ATP-grasp superfamily ATP-dependent carboligase
MSVTHEDNVRNAMANAAVDLIDVGAGANGTLEFQTAANAEVATLGFSATAFGDAASGVATANAISDDTDATGGTTTKAVLKDKDGNAVINCSVGTSGEDINLSNNVIAAGDTVQVSLLTYTAPV